jgi:uncharacterized membrane protein YfcA
VRRRIAIAICALAALGGVAGYYLAGHLPIVGALGFFGIVVLIVLLAVGPDRSWTRADDVRRAHEHEEHPMPEGPAPPFQS